MVMPNAVTGMWDLMSVKNRVALTQRFFRVFTDGYQEG